MSLNPVCEKSESSNKFYVITTYSGLGHVDHYNILTGFEIETILSSRIRKVPVYVIH